MKTRCPACKRYHYWPPIFGKLQGGVDGEAHDFCEDCLDALETTGAREDERREWDEWANAEPESAAAWISLVARGARLQ